MISIAHDNNYQLQFKFCRWLC